MARKFAQAALVALIGSAIAGTAGAQSVGDSRETAHARITYADLNLSTESGRDHLARRVTAAAHRICGPAPSRLELAATNRYRACIDETMASSVPTQEEAAARQSTLRVQMASHK